MELVRRIVEFGSLVKINVHAYLVSTWRSLFTKQRGQPWAKIFSTAYRQKFNRVFSMAQLRALRGIVSTPAVVSYCAEHDLKHREVQVPGQRAKLHFVGDGGGKDGSATGRVLLFVAGGGYHNPISLGHLDYGVECANAAKASLVFLEYTLAPGLEYPGQLIEVVEAFRWLLTQYKASDIIIGGDSAGGNLVLALITHIMKPSPYTAALELPSGQHIKAVFLISPWVSVQYTTKSYDLNADSDYLTLDMAKRFQECWNPVLNEIWAEPLIGSSEFWKNLPVDKIILTAGTWEIFRDDILELGQKMMDSADSENSITKDSKVTVVHGDTEPHVGPIFDALLGIKDGVSAVAILNWLKAL